MSLGGMCPGIDAAASLQPPRSSCIPPPLQRPTNTNRLARTSQRRLATERWPLAQGCAMRYPVANNKAHSNPTPTSSGHGWRRLKWCGCPPRWSLRQKYHQPASAGYPSCRCAAPDVAGQLYGPQTSPAHGFHMFISSILRLREETGSPTTRVRPWTRFTTCCNARSEASWLV